MCYVKYERYLLAKIILYFFIFILNNFTTILTLLQKYQQHFYNLTYIYIYMFCL